MEMTFRSSPHPQDNKAASHFFFKKEANLRETEQKLAEKPLLCPGKAGLSPAVCQQHSQPPLSGLEDPCPPAGFPGQVTDQHVQEPVLLYQWAAPPTLAWVLNSFHHQGRRGLIIMKGIFFFKRPNFKNLRLNLVNFFYGGSCLAKVICIIVLITTVLCMRSSIKRLGHVYSE